LKVAGSIPDDDDVIGIIIELHYGLGVNLSFNISKYLPGVKKVGA
jgi:hypothetical protein